MDAENTSLLESQPFLCGTAAVLGALLVLPFLSQFGVAGPHEEGLMTAPAMRIFEGEVPYRDFSTRTNPGTYYVLALLYGVISPTVTGARALVVILAATMAGCLQRIGSRFLKGPWSLFPVALFVMTGITHFPVVNHHWLGATSFLAGMLALLRWDEKPGPSRAAQLGVVVACAWWFLQHDGGVVGLTVLLYAFLCRPQGWLRDLAVMALAFFTASALLWSHMLYHNGARALFDYTILEPLKFHVSFSEFKYSWEPLRNHWNAFLAGWPNFAFNGPALKWLGHSLSYLGVWWVKYGLFYLVMWGTVAGLAVRKGKLPRPFLIVFGGVWLMTLTQGRQDMLYLNYINTGWYLVLGLLVYEFLPLRAVWAALIAGLFGLQYLFGFSDSLSYRYPITALRGTYYSKSPEEARYYSDFYRTVNRLSPPGSYILAYPYFPSLTFLTGTRNIGRPPIVLPQAYSDEIIKNDIVPRLAEVKPEFIYRLPLTAQSLIDTPGADPETFFVIMEEWDRQILADYELFQDRGLIQIYRRKKDEKAPLPESEP